MSAYAKVGTFPPNYKFLRVGDSCTFKATKHHSGWVKGMEVSAKILRIYLYDKHPHIIVSIDPTKHKMLSTLFCIYPKGAPEFDFFLKIKGTNLETKIRQRAIEARKAAFQGDLILPFGK